MGFIPSFVSDHLLLLVGVHVPLHFSADHCVATLSTKVAGMIWPGGASKPPRDAIDVQEEEERRRQERQRALVWKLCVGLGVPGVLLLTSGVALLISYFRLQSRRKQLLWRSSRMPLHFSHCDPGGKYHLFLSHTWLSGQDQARAHQARQSTLARFRHVHGVSTGAPDQAAADHAGALAPSMSIFLDVDNLHAPLSVAADMRTRC